MNYFRFLCASISMTHDESKPWWSFSVHSPPAKQVSCLRYLTYCSAAVSFTCNRLSRALNASAGLGKQIEHARWCNVVCTIEHLWWTVAWSGATTSASLCAGRVNKAAFSCHGFRLWRRAEPCRGSPLPHRWRERSRCSLLRFLCVLSSVAAERERRHLSRARSC